MNGKDAHQVTATPRKIEGTLEVREDDPREMNTGARIVENPPPRQGEKFGAGETT